MLSDKIHLNKLNLIIDNESKKSVLVLFILLIINVFFELIGIAALIPLVKYISSNKLPENLDLEMFNEIDRINLIIFIVSTYLILNFVKFIYQIFLTYKQSYFSEKVAANASLKILNNYTNMNLLDFKKSSNGQKIKNLRIEIGGLVQYLNSLLIFIVEIIIIVSISIFLIIYDPLSFLLVFLVIGAGSYLYVYFSKSTINSLAVRREKADKRTTEQTLQILNFFKELNIYNLRDKMTKEYIHLCNEKVNVNSRFNTINNSNRYFIELLLILSFISLYIFFVYKDFDQAEIITLFGVLIGASIKILPSINKIISANNSLIFYSNSVIIIHNILNTQGLNFNLFKKDAMDISEISTIKFKNVKFNYSSSNPQFNIDKTDFNKGDIVAIKGDSGSGKSTFTELLLGLLLPISGKILVNETPLNLIKNYSDKVSFVSQETSLLNKTISYNITLNENTNEINHDKLYQVINDASLNDVIEKYGLNFLLSENGKNLSGGQRQRISIARALYKESDVFIFDEITSSLDKNNAMKIINNIYQIPNKIIIFITHDEEIFYKSNKRFLFKEGKLIKD